MDYIICDGELYHHGIKGMRWGVRRSSNEIRADRINTNSKKLGGIQSIGKGSSSAFNEASNVARTISRSSSMSKKTKKTLSSMSDQELRTKINRMQMEQQYASLNPSRVSRGAECVSNILSVAGSVAAIGGSIAGIALAINQMKLNKIGK